MFCWILTFHYLLIITFFSFGKTFLKIIGTTLKIKKGKQQSEKLFLKYNKKISVLSSK